MKGTEKSNFTSRIIGPQLKGQQQEPELPHPVPLQAGRSLDALIDEKVFGHVIGWRNSFSWRTDIIPEIQGRVRGFDLVTESRIAGAWVPEYSTSIASAWEVVERMWPTGFQLHRSQFVDDGGEEWTVGVEIGVSFYEKGCGSSPAEAICIAAIGEVSS